MFVGSNLVKDFVNEKVYEYSSEWLDNVIEMIRQQLLKSH